jgi:hypothetical protein
MLSVIYVDSYVLIPVTYRCLILGFEEHFYRKANFGEAETLNGLIFPFLLSKNLFLLF